MPTKPCGFRGCAGRADTKGLCGAHYQQQRQGKPLKVLQVQFHGMSEQERFEKYVSRESVGCWLWTGSKDARGYGRFRNAYGQPELAHRVAWRFYRKVETGKLYVLHRCDNSRCVNPKHLYLGTQTDNMADMWARGRQNPGVSFGENHGNAKLTDAAVHDIRTSQDSATELARRHGVASTTVYDVRYGKIWKHHATPPVAQKPRHRLTDADVKEILRSTEASDVLEDRYGVVRHTIANIRKRRAWRHISNKPTRSK